LDMHEFETSTVPLSVRGEEWLPYAQCH